MSSYTNINLFCLSVTLLFPIITMPFSNWVAKFFSMLNPFSNSYKIIVTPFNWIINYYFLDQALSFILMLLVIELKILPNVISYKIFFSKLSYNFFIWYCSNALHIFFFFRSLSRFPRRPQTIDWGDRGSFLIFHFCSFCFYSSALESSYYWFPLGQRQRHSSHRLQIPKPGPTSPSIHLSRNTPIKLVPQILIYTNTFFLQS